MFHVMFLYVLCLRVSTGLIRASVCLSFRMPYVALWWVLMPVLGSVFGGVLKKSKVALIRDNLYIINTVDKAQRLTMRCVSDLSWLCGNDRNKQRPEDLKTTKSHSCIF